MTPRSQIPFFGIEVAIGLYLDARKRCAKPATSEQEAERWAAYVKEMAQRWGWDEQGK